MLRKVLGLALPAASRVLDVPCGEGRLVSGLVEAGFDVSAGDIQASPGVAAERFRLVDLDRQPLPWTDESFDAVLSVEGIEHLENPYHLLREIRRVLRPGGFLILTTPNILSLRSRVRFFGSGFFHRDPRPLNESARHPLHHIGLRSLPMLRYDLHTTGFEIEQVGCTHIRAVSWGYVPFVPYQWLYTAMAFRKEKDRAQRARNVEIRRALFSKAALFGENLMLVARKKGSG